MTMAMAMAMAKMTTSSPIELWGGIECTVNRVGDRYFDQIERCGHAGRADDLDRFAALGLRTLRYPLLWERIAPDGLERADWRLADERMARMRTLGIRPIVGLVHHGSGPRSTSLVDPGFADGLARFASAVARRYPWVTDYTPVNEPLTTARFSGLYGHWYPHGSDDETFVRALVVQCRAIVQSMAAIRAVTPEARLVVTEDFGRTQSTSPLARQCRFDNDRRLLSLDLLTGLVDRSHPLHRYLADNGAGDLGAIGAGPPPDVVGLNYYITSDRWLDHRVDDYPRWALGGNRFMRYADVDAARGAGDGLLGHEAVLQTIWDRYRRPVALTEVHVGGPREMQLGWLTSAWGAAERARAAGVDVRAVTVWSLLGAFDWNHLVARDDGFYEPGPFDVLSGVPRRTALADLVGALADGRPFEHPALADGGWPPSPLARARPRRPVLIFGSGTLGRAFARICELRGLPHRLVTRADVDITDGERVRAAIRALSPWVVVNAAGYVHVDAAEGEPDVCHRVNVVAAGDVAAACAEADVALVSFSSDLVFDGTAERPYVESDAVNPLSVYGASKAAAESSVAGQHPAALIVRTGACFGPWDEANFVATALADLRAGRSFAAASDVTISPTYVPDLVHACLDLAIDGEHGLWHLANRGSVSWVDFAESAARHAGLDTGLIVARTLAELRLPARRPPRSALGSARGRILPPLEVALERFFDDRAVAVADAA